MPYLRTTTLIAAMLAAFSTCLYVIAKVQHWSTHQSTCAWLAAVTLLSSVALFCTDVVVRAVEQARKELAAELGEEMKRQVSALHHVIAENMEHYGDARAIDATVAAEGRRLADGREDSRGVRRPGFFGNVTSMNGR